MKTTLSTGFFALAVAMPVAMPVSAHADVIGHVVAAPAGPGGFGAPLPLDPPATDQALPSAEQLSGILTNLTDPSVPDQVKDGLVEGGYDRRDDHRLSHALRRAERRGELPLNFQLSNIASSGQGTVTADAQVTGPRLGAPVTKTVSFVDQGGWLVSYESAAELFEEITGRPER